MVLPVVGRLHGGAFVDQAQQIRALGGENLHLATAVAPDAGQGKEDVFLTERGSAHGKAAPGDFDKALFEDQISKSYGARQGDSRFARWGIAESRKAGSDDSFQGDVACRAERVPLRVRTRGTGLPGCDGSPSPG